MKYDDDGFREYVAERLALLPNVLAVTLGGSRALGTHSPDSDWDFGIYYRGPFDPDDLRGIGWEGDVFDVGAWGAGVFNGGAWLTVDGRHVDVLYRDLDVIERELEEARAGRFHWEPLMFHLAGIPSYLVVAELAVNEVLRGTLPRPKFPEALRESAPKQWRERANLTMMYAKNAYAVRGQLTEVAGALATAAMYTAHAVLAARGEWVLNEKRMLADAGLREIDQIIAELGQGPDSLARAVAAAEQLFAEK
ncbi:nucleotidyltransferase domain-containing protein [Nocardia otitidiscaviarum]|uniref:nucleotidyltransferase domain-containing protein n=1 Tax=Nocardia otitidiscaviarum TaxID=1823 RepID=UPI0018947DF0|nr:nucleotidyltransferase domain-containing protein [Nocardia otitidiscaviarum]MBF6177279.1 nucleotidyltransferase domain-containing protein [Nocardia otitidiscaviarum]